MYKGISLLEEHFCESFHGAFPSFSHVLTCCLFGQQLEYMDLDEFLNENGIPLDENGKRTTSASSGGSSTNSTSNGTGGNLTLGSVLSPEAPSSPESPQRVGSGMGVAGGPQTPVPLGHAAAPITVLPPALSPQECSLDGYPSSPESSVSLDPHDPLQVHEPGELNPNISSLTLPSGHPTLDLTYPVYMALVLLFTCNPSPHSIHSCWSNHGRMPHS